MYTLYLEIPLDKINRKFSQQYKSDNFFCQLKPLAFNIMYFFVYSGSKNSARVLLLPFFVSEKSFLERVRFYPKNEQGGRGMFPSSTLKTAYLSYPVRSPHAPKGKAAMQVRHDHLLPCIPVKL